MGKLDYLDALKRAMTGLPPEAQAKTLAFYEQRFVDGVAAGRTEQDIASELDDPKKIAMTLRANAHMQAFDTKKNPANMVRMVVAILGLAIFNLFMVVPAMVYAALLAALYACGLLFYLGGAVITASGLSGANEIKLDGPLPHLFVHGDMDDQQTKVSISEEGIRIFFEPGPDGRTAARANARAADAAARVADQAARAAEQAGKAAEEAGQAVEEAARTAQTAATAAADAAAHAVDAIDDDDEADDKRSVRVIKRAESVASQGIVVSTDVADGSRATQTLFGFCVLLGGIILLLISLLVTRFTFIGLKRYIEMNYSLLKGN